MGTHPIFESDFDCLTEWLGKRTLIPLKATIRITFTRAEFSAPTDRPGPKRDSITPLPITKKSSPLVIFSTMPHLVLPKDLFSMVKNLFLLKLTTRSSRENLREKQNCP